VAHADLRGEVGDRVGREVPDRVGERVGVLEHSDRRLESGRLQQHLVAPFLQAHVVVGRHAVEPRDDPAFVEQKPRQVKADEAGRARDEDARLRHVMALRSPVLFA